MKRYLTASTPGSGSNAKTEVLCQYKIFVRIQIQNRKPATDSSLKCLLQRDRSSPAPEQAVFRQAVKTKVTWQE